MASLNSRRTVLSIVALVLVALVWKVIYLKTAESTYNTEELPLAPITLVAGSDVLTDIAATRLYGTSAITSAASFELFGFTPLGVKFPNIVFFLTTIILLCLLCKRLLSEDNRYLWMMPGVLLVVGPPVIQIWGMKNRGGFIEGIFALVLCLWLCSRTPEGRPLSDLHKLIIALVIGVATWSQPLSLVWGIVLVGYILWQDAAYSIRNVPKSSVIVLMGLLIGAMPLVYLNFIFGFNTFQVLSHGEVPGGVDLGKAGRLREILVGGVPRLLGLKRQWQDDWVLSPPVAWCLYFIFVFPAIRAAVRAVINFLTNRRVGLDLALVGVALAVVAANVISTWGNFQEEPRRLLLLYVPLVVLTMQGLRGSRIFLPVYLLIWVAFNLFSNYTYIRDHANGFSSGLYRPLDGLAEKLADNGITGVYADVWVGPRLTFASKGTIPWYRSQYVPTAYGYVGDQILTANEAMLFNMQSKAELDARSKFFADAASLGANCAEIVFDNFSIVHHCDAEIDLGVAFAGFDGQPTSSYATIGKLSTAVDGEGTRYLGKGWSKPEQWGVWLDGGSGVLTFGGLESQGDPAAYVMRLVGRVYTSPKHPTQRIQVFVAGELVTEVTTRYPETNSVISFPVKSEWVSKGGFKLVLVTPDAISPKNLGYSLDSRELSFGLEYIELDILDLESRE
ncbi:glycosyltransferase family 39 protein [Novilysobacter arseniciresistens]|uniref:glycosyltransferase family 39 protein n=1 Tax=Novilysobacter arseniciresistens TaxID=1385522 RepID=UPI0009DEF86D|nr:glycosyltransferase family 39 protein [Lysobacter arseniciresistens]